MNKTSRVLMLVENMPAPADVRVWAEATTLRDAGYKVSIISPKGLTKHRESHTCIEDIHIYRYQLPTNVCGIKGYIAEYLIALLMTFLLSLKIFFSQGFDVIHAANPPDLFFIIGLIYRPFGKKFVFDQHDVTPELFQVKFHERARRLHKLIIFLERSSLHTAQLAITSNLSQKWFAITRGHYPPHKIFVVRNGPDLQRTHLVPAEPELKGGRRYLLAYVGLMAKQDGVEIILYALHHLIYQCNRQDVSLVLMGDGECMPMLRALAQKLQLDSYVKFTGLIEHNDVLRYLSVADAGLIPDPQNGMNEFCTMIKTMEYMALGKPIVAFDLAETRFSAQDAALYATPNLTEDFAHKIDTLLDDEEARHRMGAIGRERVEQELSWEHSSEHLLLAYSILFDRLPTSSKTIDCSPALRSRTTGNYEAVKTTILK